MQIQSPNMPISHGFALTWGNDSGPRSGMVHFLSWTFLKDHCDTYAMPLEAMLVYVVHSAASGCVETQNPCECTHSVLQTEALVMSSGFADSQGHADVSGLCSHPRPC